MALESILNHILQEANKQREEIIQEARLKAQDLIRQAHQEAAELYQNTLDKEKALLTREKQKIIVNARLDSKKNLLMTQQELIDVVFDKLKFSLKSEKFKKQQIYLDKVKEAPEDIDFYLNRLRLEHEAEIARILFS